MSNPARARTDEPLYRWIEHPGMTPRPESYFIGYWTTMPRPTAERQARAAFKRFVRDGQLIQVRVSDDELLAAIAG